MEQAQQQTSSSLYAASKILQTECNSANAEFVRCKQEKPNPSDCVIAGGKVLSCVNNTVNNLRDVCKESFQSYSACLEKNNLGYDKCRDEQILMTRCFKSSKINDNKQTINVVTAVVADHS